MAASLQSGSEHPLARAVVQAAQEKGLGVAAPENLRSVAGRGLEGEVAGRSYLIGSLPEVPGSRLAKCQLSRPPGQSGSNPSGFRKA